MIDFSYVNPKKKFALILFIVLGAICALATEFLIKPQISEQEKQLRQITGELNTTKTKILEIEEELAYTRERKDDFEILQKAGFFEDQQRMVLQDVILKSEQASQIIGGNFKIGAPVCFVNDPLKESDYVLLGSEIEITADAYEDLSIYNFIDLFINNMPGYVVIEEIRINRITDLTRSYLQQVGTGQEIPIINSILNMTWYTIRKKEDSLCSNTNLR